MGITRDLVEADRTIPAYLTRNKLINGGFDIWQRGETFTNPNDYTADRWYGNIGTFEHVTNTPVPPGTGLLNGVKLTKTSGQDMQLLQRLEPKNANAIKREFSGRTFTISFWLYDPSDIGIENIFFIKDKSNNTSLLPDYEVNQLTKAEITTTTVNDIWNYVTSTITLNFANDEGEYIEVRIDPANLGSGSMTITGVQLEEGSVATPFEQRPIGLELSLCQRYYQKVACGLEMYSIAGNFYSIMGSYIVPPRVSPSLSEVLITTFNVAGFQVADIDGGKGFSYQCLSNGTQNLSRQSVIIVDAEL